MDTSSWIKVEKSIMLILNMHNQFIFSYVEKLLNQKITGSKPGNKFFDSSRFVIGI